MVPTPTPKPDAPPTPKPIDVGPGPTPKPGGGPNAVGPRVTSLTRLGRQPSQALRANRRAFIVLSESTDVGNATLIKVGLSQTAALRLTLARELPTGGYKTLRSAVIVRASGTTVLLRPTGSWNGRVLPRGVYRLRALALGGTSRDLVLRFR